MVSTFNNDLSSYISTFAANPAISAATCNNHDLYKIINEHIVSNWDNLQEKAKDYEAKREQDKLKGRQVVNKYCRSLVKHVHWSGNTCIMYWSDGTQTKARWDNAEDFDPEKAMLVCMARKLFMNSGIYNEVLEKYKDAGWDHWEDQCLYPINWEND